ncbi:MAG: methylenetetrahydrofolate reductase [Pseudonocardiaceae bacterium]|nr:methylenetetrahydrofolate reductase [Pseudonocardiaceae bacterium]
MAGGAFTVTAELGPPRGAQTTGVRAKVAALRDCVDAVNITDNQSSYVRLASWAGSMVALDEGVEPVMQVACRDRNRIALQSDLMSAAAFGVVNVLALTGDDPKQGNHPDATPVFDLDSTGLLQAARNMRDEGRLLSGEVLDPAPQLFLGAVENAVPSSAGPGAQRLAKKVDAGAQFVQTQFVFDVAEFAEWMHEVRDLGLDERCHILAGVGPIRSLRGLERMRGIPGIRIPDQVAHRLGGVPPDRVADEGHRICAEVIAQLREVDGVAGAHVMAIGQEEAIPGILQQAGVVR